MLVHTITRAAESNEPCFLPTWLVSDEKRAGVDFRFSTSLTFYLLWLVILQYKIFWCLQKKTENALSHQGSEDGVNVTGLSMSKYVLMKSVDLTFTKGSSISKSFSLWLQSPRKGAKSLCILKGKCSGEWFGTFCWGLESN